MYDDKIEGLISAALADGELTEKEKQILFKKAQAEGIDLDEFEMVLDARLVQQKKAEQQAAQAAQVAAAQAAAQAAKAKESSAPKSNKYGDVRKCPVCGAIIPPLAGVCPECGYEFSGVEANRSSQQLAEQLVDTYDPAKKKEIIETFPIPNTKSDLFEFLTSIQPRMRDVKDPLSGAYFKKYQECINKAKASFSNDANLRPFIDSFEKEEKSLIRKQRLQSILNWCGNHKGLTALIIIILLSVPSSIIESIKEKRANNQVEESRDQIDQAINGGNEDEIMKAIEASPRMEAEKAENLVRKLIKADNLDAAIYLCENKVEGLSAYRNDAINKMLYEALIKAERMDDAWNYKELISPDINNIANADDCKHYIIDVVNQYCSVGKKEEAHRFVKGHLVWFINNIDNNVELSDGKESDYGSVQVQQYMDELINNY